MSAVPRQMVIASVGAVTSVGLTAPQTCSALRAGISGIKQTILRPPPEEPLLAARVPATGRLRRGEREWLVNLACRAIRESLSDAIVAPERTVLLLSLPEPHRGHPAFFRDSPQMFIAHIEHQLGIRFAEGSNVLLGGHAAPLQALSICEEVLTRDQSVCLCGVDSLLNASDVDALSSAGRLRDLNRPQGVIPGEGAACVLLASAHRTPVHLSIVAGWGAAQEADTVLGDNYSVGRGLAQAIADATAAAGVSEPEIDFRVSDMNGERYCAWESFLAGTRYYRTHRDNLPFHLPAAGVGDVGAASAVLSLVVAATSIARGYAPGPVACCEASSAMGSRAAALVVSAAGAPKPPFRSRYSRA